MSASTPLREALRDMLVIALATGAIAVIRARVPSPAQPSIIATAIAGPAVQPEAGDPSLLRVCADPNNLPFSNERGQGFENALAELVASHLGRRVEYHWQPQRRGFVRTTLNARRCDVIAGVPAGLEMVQTTRPYYRSTYVFVHRRGDRVRIASLDDERLHHLKIGVEVTGEDYDNPPALHALAARHVIDNVRGYLVYGDYSQPDPPRRVIDAVANREVDIAIAWGPLAGYFASRASVPLEMVPVSPQHDGAAVTFVFDIAMGVRRGDTRLREALDEAIVKRQPEINALLAKFGVPLVPRDGTP